MQMNMFKYILAFSSLALLFSSCEEVIDYELKNTERKLVIDALISDDPGPYTVKITWSAPYTKNQPTPRVSGAIVVLKDDQNHTDTLQEQAPGQYMTDASFPQGQVGHTYQLYVKHEGKEYTAISKIAPMAPIDSISYAFHEGTETGYYEETGYYVTMHTQEPPGLGNNYRFKFIVNGFSSNRSDRVLVVNDEYVDGNYITFTTPFAMQYNDTVVLEGQSLSKAAYDYYTALTVQLNPNGFFDAPPANLPTNISGGALGFFNTVSIQRIGVRIK